MCALVSVFSGEAECAVKLFPEPRLNLPDCTDRRSRLPQLTHSVLCGLATQWRQMAQVVPAVCETIGHIAINNEMWRGGWPMEERGEPVTWVLTVATMCTGPLEIRFY